MKKRGKTISVIGILAAIMVFSATFSTSASTAGHWAAGQIARWGEYGVIPLEAFRPDDLITRGELAVILDNVMDYQTKAENHFADLDAEFYTESILKANQAGVIYGSSGRIRPKDYITREEASVLFCHAFHIGQSDQSNTNFADDDAISAWAKGYVSALSNMGYLNGRGGEINYFDPKGNITRAEAITVVDRFVDGFYNKEGTYSRDSSGNVVVNSSGVVLKNMNITGNLIAAEGIGDGNLILDGVTVSGKVILKGGGVNSIYFKGNTTISTVEAARTDGDMRIVVEKEASIDRLVIHENAKKIILVGNIKNVHSYSSNEISLNESNIMDFSIFGKNTTVNIASDSKIESLTLDGSESTFTIQGNKGEIVNLNLKAFDSDVFLHGKVLKIFETGGNTQIFAEKNCDVGSIELNSEKTEVSGDGTVQTIYINAENCRVTANNTKIISKYETDRTTRDPQRDKDSSSSDKREQDAPVGLTAADAVSIANHDGKILGTTSRMEYKKVGEEVYQDCGEGETTGLTPGDYLVRYKEKSGYHASRTVTITIKAYITNQDAPVGLTTKAPASIANHDGKILGTTSRMEYKKVGEEVYQDCGEGETTGLTPGDYLIRYKAKSGYYASEPVTVTIKSYINLNQDAPIGLTTTDPGSIANHDGKILGTTSKMEYKKVGEEVYQDCGEGETTGLTPGDYLVRYKAKPGYNASEPVTVTIKKYIPVMKTILVGGQNGNLIAGTSGTATFAVTTENIADGETVSIVETDANGNLKNPQTSGLTISADNILNNQATVTAKTDTTVKNGTYYFRATCDGITSSVVTIMVDPPAKIISVGNQNGNLVAGTSGSVTFAVTTENIADGETVSIVETDANGSLKNPQTSGLTVSADNILNNQATVTAKTDTTVKNGIYYFRATCDGIPSSVVTIVVDPPAKIISVGGQNGNLVAGTSGSVTFAVTTENIADGETVSIVETDANGSLKNPQTSGLTISADNILNNQATVTAKTDTMVKDGTYYFRATCDGITSSVVTIMVDPPAKTISVGSQNGNLVAGTSGSVTFAVTMENIADGEDVFITETDEKGNIKNTTGITITSTKVLSNKATVTIIIDKTMKAGTYYFKASCDGVTSDIAIITVDEPAKTISVGGQNKKLVAGTSGTTTFDVTTENISDDKDVFVTETDKNGNSKFTTGITITSNKVLSNKTTITIGIDNTVKAGTYYFKASCDGVTSDVFTMTVESKTISVGAQSGNLVAGTSGSVTFAVRTKNIMDAQKVTATETDADGNRKTATQGLRFSAENTKSNQSTITVTIDNMVKAGTYYFKASCDGVISDIVTVTVDEPPKTISVGSQTGNLVAGTSGTTTFDVTMENIVDYQDIFITETDKDGNSQKTTGIVITTIPVSNNNKTTIMVTIDNTVKAGTYYFKVSCDGVTSDIVTVTVDEPPAKTISVGSQSGKLVAGTVGSVTFDVKTKNIADGQRINVTETDKTPPGISFETTNIISNKAIVTVKTDTTVKAGTYYFKVSCDGVTSDIAIITVDGPPKTISVGSQNGNLVQLESGSVTFDVKTENIANGQLWTITETDADGNPKSATQGLSFHSDNASTVTVTAKQYEVWAGTYYFRVSCDGVTSNVATITIQSQNISIGEQIGNLETGVPGSASFDVTTENIANGIEIKAEETDEHGNMRLTSGLSIMVTKVQDNKATVTVTIDSTLASGTYYFRLKYGSVVSGIMKIIVDPSQSRISNRDTLDLYLTPKQTD